MISSTVAVKRKDNIISIQKESEGSKIPIRYGDIIFVDLGNEAVGSEQRGIRPCVVIQNDVGNQYSPTTIVAPVTARPKKLLPTHVDLPKTMQNGLTKDSTALLEQIRCVSRDRIVRKVGWVGQNKLPEIMLAIQISLGLIEPDILKKN